MPNITNDLCKKLAEIERVLQGIPIMDINIIYSFGNKEVNSPAYILPLKNENHQIYGLYMDKEKLSEVKIGFIDEEKDLQNAKHYKPNSQGEIVSHFQTNILHISSTKNNSFSINKCFHKKN